MNEQLNLNTRLDIKQVDTDGTFSGYGSVFDVEDSYKEIVVSGAFARSLNRYKRDERMPALLWQHDPSEPIGIYTEMREDDRGLYVEGQLALKTELGARAHELLKMGALDGLSIGFVPVERDYDKDEKITRLTEIDLWEVSLVTFPANTAARITGVKSPDGVRTQRDLEKCLRDSGYSRAGACEIASRFAEKHSQSDSSGVDDASADELDALKKLAVTINPNR